MELKIKIRGNGNSINTSSVNAKTSLLVPIWGEVAFYTIASYTMNENVD